MKKIALLLALSFFASSQASAHVTNEATVYSDIAYSEAAADILLLNTLGLISGSRAQEFRPLDLLAAADFEAWISHSPFAKNLPDFFSGKAVDYGLVNTVLFGGRLLLEHPRQTMTREEFAVFVADHADVEVDGHTLFTRAGFAAGPTGEIAAVDLSEKGYILEIGNERYPLGVHPRIQSESIDPEIWEGMELVKSWIGPDVKDGQTGSGEMQQTEAIQYAVIEPKALHVSEEASKEEMKSNALVKADLDEDAGKVNWITIVAVFCAALLVYWINKKKKHEIE